MTGVPRSTAWTLAKFLGALACLALRLVACRAPVLTVDDGVFLPGEKTQLSACVEREPVFGLCKDVEQVKVEFRVDGQTAAATKTNKHGLAEVERQLDAGLEHYEARALVDGRELRADGRVYTWDKQRVIIAIDIDHTISQTEYKTLLRTDHEDESNPIKRSVDTLRTLARDFHILYLTGRPRFLIDKTRLWLCEHDFPPGPVITSIRVRDLVAPEAFKERRLHALRKSWPHLLIGIGNRPSDADAYGANGMLCLAVPAQAGQIFPPHALVFRDWKAVDEFFAANRGVLDDPEQLEQAIKGRRMLLRSLEQFHKR